MAAPPDVGCVTRSVVGGPCVAVVKERDERRLCPCEPSCYSSRSWALLPLHSGVDNYLKQLVWHLGRVDRSNTCTVFLNFADRRLFDGILPLNFSVRPVCWRPHLRRWLFQQGALPAAAKALSVDVVHSPRS